MATYPAAVGFAQFTGQASPLLAVAGSIDRPFQGVVGCQVPWGVTEIKLSAGGKSSRSFSDRGHADIAAGRTADGRFYFAPKSDDVAVTWKLKNPGNAGTVTLELYASGSGVPIWRRTLNTEDTVKQKLDAAWDGSFPAGEWVATARFPDSLVTVEGSPYMMRITADASAEAGFVERWTFFDVLVEKLELHWGGVARIPAGRPAGVADSYAARTVADELALLKTLSGNDQGNGAIGAARQLVKLPSNHFPRTVEEQKNEAMYQGHRDMWGAGPRIPLRAKIWIRTAGDAGVHAGETAKALGQCKFLWDWESEDELAKLAAIPYPAVRNFLRNSLDYKRNDNTCPPGSTNCHVEHGGKRGAGETVFPTAMAPFPLAAAATRVWAATTQAALTGADAGWTGLVFQPSRIAGDTYKISVYLASEKAGPGLSIDVLGSAADLRRDHAELPFAESGWFENKRVVRSRYIRKAPAVETADLNVTTTEYARAGLILDWAPAGDEANFHASYNTYFDRMMNDQLHNEANVLQAGFKSPAAGMMRAIPEAFAGLDQFTGGLAGAGGAGVGPAFTAHAYAVFREGELVKAIRRYVCNKPRKFNSPLKAYNAWRVNNPVPADDSAWLLNFYNQLSAKRKAKIDAPFALDMRDRGTRTEAEYRTKISSATIQGFKVVAGQYLNAVADDGFMCFHCTDHVRIRQADGTIVEVPTGVGGLAPSDSTTRDRKKAINLMYLLQTVPANRVGVPDVYDISVTPIIKHETGHNFYLVHAPAAHDAPRDAGGNVPALHDAADMRCLMNYDPRSDHLCGMCNLRLRGWSAHAGGGLVALSNASAGNRVP